MNSVGDVEERWKKAEDRMRKKRWKISMEKKSLLGNKKNSLKKGMQYRKSEKIENYKKNFIKKRYLEWILLKLSTRRKK